MKKLKNPAAGWPTALGKTPLAGAPELTSKELDLQLLAEGLAPGESVQFSPDVWFSKPASLVLDLEPVPEGWQEEFGQAHTHPRTGEILFHRALFKGPARPWQTLSDKEASIILSDARKAYPHVLLSINSLFHIWRLSPVRPSTFRMNDEVRELWKFYDESKKTGGARPHEKPRRKPRVFAGRDDRQIATRGERSFGKLSRARHWVHPWIWKITCTLRKCGINDPDVLFELIQKNCSDPDREREIWDAIRNSTDEKLAVRSYQPVWPERDYQLATG